MNQYREKNGGIYIHVPFCVKKCAYCDFYSCTELDKIPQYIDALIDEINMAQDDLPCFDTIYFGGGTPSLLAPEQILRLINAAYKRFCIAPDPEITIEANPGTVNPQNLSGYRRAGVNRINIGVQSFSDPALRFLSRIHSAKDALEAIEQARSSGFKNIGLDLIYGLPGQTEPSWRSDLQAAVRLGPQHLSCYMLTYEPGTQMENDLVSGRFRPLPDKHVGRLYDLTVQFLEDGGYSQYEVSNFASSAHTRSRHNQKYWSHSPYFGFGPSAHTFINDCRSWNVRYLEPYLHRTGKRERPVEHTETLEQRQLMMETLYLRLRCNDGLVIPAFERRFQIDFEEMFGPVIFRCTADGLLACDDGCCRLTCKGMLFADSVAARFIDLV